jgi:DNA-binding transcriptional LysR family regulator
MADELTVAVVPGVSADKWARIWRERLPAVPLTVVQVAEDGAIAALADGADLAFARLPVPEDAGLHVIPLWEEVPVAVAAKDHPLKVVDSVTLAELEGEELHPGADNGTLDIVAAGHGIARMPQSVFRATGRRDLVARPITDAPATRIGLVWPSGRSGPLIDEFIGIVRGRTANSSRGTPPPPAPAPRRRERPKRGAAGRGATRRNRSR